MASFFSDPNFYKQYFGNDYYTNMAKQYGVSTDQLAQLYAQDNTIGQGGQGAYGGGPAVGAGGGSAPYVSYPKQGPNQLTADLRTLQMMKDYGGGGQQSQGPTNKGSVLTDPIYAATNLGAAALQMPAIYNPTPEEASAVSGVGKIAKATTSGDVIPDVPRGPWSNTPGMFTRAPTVAPTQTAQTVAPIPQATAAQVGAPVPFAQAPAAPGIDLSAHTSALENAGKALFAHFGGDPNTASHADIANFHSQMMADLGGAGASNTGNAGGPTVALTPTDKTPVKMKYGGVVPGDPEDDTDSVNAKLSPGEVVIPKHRLTERPAPMQAAPQAPSAGTDKTSGATNQTSDKSSSSSPAASGQIDWQKIDQARQAQQANQGWNAMGTNAYQAPAGSSTLTVGDIAGGASIPGGGQTQSLGKLGGTGGGAGGAISGLASGLASAAQAYADSIKPWQVQASHIPSPDDFKNRYAAMTFGQAGA